MTKTIIIKNKNSKQISLNNFNVGFLISSILCSILLSLSTGNSIAGGIGILWLILMFSMMVTNGFNVFLSLLFLITMALKIPVLSLALGILIALTINKNCLKNLLKRGWEFKDIQNSLVLETIQKWKLDKYIK